MDWELPDGQAGFRKGRGTRDQIADIRWLVEIAREFQKNICFIDDAKAFGCVDHNKLWKTLKKRWKYHLTCLPRNLYAGQEETIWTGHETTDWFQIGKEVGQGCILSPCLFNFYAECIMRNPLLDKVQTGIKIAWRNVNQFSRLVMSNSLRTHGLQHARPPCPFCGCSICSDFGAPQK